MIYLKKIIAQDLDRTPTFSQDSWQSFFKLPLENDENIELTFIDAKDSLEYECAIKRRATRNEIRVFIKDILNKYSAKVGDVIIFKPRNDLNSYTFNYLQQDKYNFDVLNIIFNDKNHQLLIQSNDCISDNNQHVGYNKIIYGAPGAGKSYKVNTIVGDNYIRTVFHPETQYSDFIGCLKPHKDNQGAITYSFRKGPFIRILEKALLNPSTHYYLVIEELNRANTAAVFGEIFQLLDRDETGKSEYPISIQDEDLFNALIKDHEGKLSLNPYICKRELIIPNNLSIIATMNSSDQAVYPLDTAFKRRWIFEYLPIDFRESAKGQIPINNRGCESIEWVKLAEVINQELIHLGVAEDKLIGPWFIKTSDLIDEMTARETFVGKICSYLWDDALKYKDKGTIFSSNIQGYGQLHQMYIEGQSILSENFINKLAKIKEYIEYGDGSK